MTKSQGLSASHPHGVIPAKAGTRRLNRSTHGIPAYAGMTPSKRCA